MKMKTTEELDKALLNTAPAKIGDYIKENDKYMTAGPKSFYYYFKDVIDSKGIKLKDLYAAAGVTESYGSKIVTMEKHTKNRDLIIRLCLAGHFNLIEINRSLKMYGLSELYSKDPRDACIIVAVNNRIFDQRRIDSMLKEQGLTVLH